MLSFEISKGIENESGGNLNSKKLKKSDKIGIKTFRRKNNGREKCLILLMLSEKQTEHAEMILSHNRYFGYNGIICMSQARKFSISIFFQFLEVFFLRFRNHAQLLQKKVKSKL
jgi:hypothetical protein